MAVWDSLRLLGHQIKIQETANWKQLLNEVEMKAKLLQIVFIRCKANIIRITTSCHTLVGFQLCKFV
jgi:hypothetical protein